MKKQYCNRCKREIDWEEREMLQTATKDQLIDVISALRLELNKKEVKWNTS